MDHDVGGADDLIGETSIDLELRYYSQHKAASPLQHVFNRYLFLLFNRSLCVKSNMFGGKSNYEHNKIIE